MWEKHADTLEDKAVATCILIKISNYPILILHRMNIYKEDNVTFWAKVSIWTLFKISIAKLFAFCWKSPDHQAWRTYLKKKENPYSHNIRFKIVYFYCINFVYGPCSFIKYKIELIWLELTCRLIVKIGNNSFCRRQNTKKLKTVFYSLISAFTQIFYTPQAYITQKTSAKTTC